jgi:nicotinamide/nicotinate riboside kinase
LNRNNTAYSSSLAIPSLGVQSDPEGTFWRDPPGYWEDIVYPAYVEAHKDVFENGDVEHGKPTNKVEGLVLLESLNISMNEAVERCCEVIKEVGGRKI